MDGGAGTWTGTGGAGTGGAARRSRGAAASRGCPSATARRPRSGSPGAGCTHRPWGWERWGCAATRATPRSGWRGRADRGGRPRRRVVPWRAIGLAVVALVAIVGVARAAGVDVGVAAGTTGSGGTRWASSTLRPRAAVRPPPRHPIRWRDRPRTVRHRRAPRAVSPRRARRQKGRRVMCRRETHPRTGGRSSPSWTLAGYARSRTPTPRCCRRTPSPGPLHGRRMLPCLRTCRGVACAPGDSRRGCWPSREPTTMGTKRSCRSLTSVRATRWSTRVGWWSRRSSLPVPGAGRSSSADWPPPRRVRSRPIPQGFRRPVPRRGAAPGRGAAPCRTLPPDAIQGGAWPPQSRYRLGSPRASMRATMRPWSPTMRQPGVCRDCQRAAQA